LKIKLKNALRSLAHPHPSQTAFGTSSMRTE
jgi:hypothetical protein